MPPTRSLSLRVLKPDESSPLPSTLLPDVWALSPSRPSPSPPPLSHNTCPPRPWPPPLGHIDNIHISCHTRTRCTCEASPSVQNRELGRASLSLLYLHLPPIVLIPRSLFRPQPVSSPVTICGDIHGQFWDLLELLRKGSSVPEMSYIFMARTCDARDIPLH